MSVPIQQQSNPLVSSHSEAATAEKGEEQGFGDIHDAKTQKTMSVPIANESSKMKLRPRKQSVPVENERNLRPVSVKVINAQCKDPVNNHSSLAISSAMRCCACRASNKTYCHSLSCSCLQSGKPCTCCRNGPDCANKNPIIIKPDSPQDQSELKEKEISSGSISGSSSSSSSSGSSCSSGSGSSSVGGGGIARVSRMSGEGLKHETRPSNKSGGSVEQKPRLKIPPASSPLWKDVNEDLEKALGPVLSDRTINTMPSDELASQFTDIIYSVLESHFEVKKEGRPVVVEKVKKDQRLEELRALKKELRKAHRQVLRGGGKGSEAERVLNKRWFEVVHEHSRLSKLVQERNEAKRSIKQLGQFRADPMKFGKSLFEKSI